MQDGKEFYALVAIEESKAKLHDHNSLVHPLLQGYANVITYELPHGLIPMRDIQYCIDLILNFQKKTSYVMILEQHKEL